MSSVNVSIEVSIEVASPRYQRKDTYLALVPSIVGQTAMEVTFVEQEEMIKKVAPL